jgi:hypothetical protein
VAAAAEARWEVAEKEKERAEVEMAEVKVQLARAMIEADETMAQLEEEWKQVCVSCLVFDSYIHATAGERVGTGISLMFDVWCSTRTYMAQLEKIWEQVLV